MTTVSDLQARRDVLVKQREGLVKTVRTGDRTVEFDLQQTNDSLAEIDRQLNVLNGRKVVRQVRMYSKGKGY